MCPKTDEERQRMYEVSYASAVGNLMYAMLCTRPDIAFAVNVVSKYQSNLGERHWTTIKAILKYLRRTKELILGYGGLELTLKGYSDSDFQSDVDDRKSTSAFIFVCNEGAVSWKSAKQSTTVDSTTEAEYIVALEATKEAKELRAHQKSKHVQRKYHILREFIGVGDIVIQKIASIDNLTDPLTKALTQRLLDQHLERMGIRYYNDWL
ncbi:secreted RxLR effector protein 161-like [Mangifera indica]|uniref:secreted RxLR effector protein 161-like n=1 Tax=Mangifera indica TaxID=29780 RepID=UPI001CFB0528|nr:secreted RxLR effector protein 161-like [Mangifera indica]